MQTSTRRLLGALLIALGLSVAGCGAIKPYIEVPKTPIRYTVLSTEEGSQGTAQWAKFTVYAPQDGSERGLRYVLLAMTLEEAKGYDAAVVDFRENLLVGENRTQRGYIMNTRAGLTYCIDQSPPTLAPALREAYKQDGVYVIGWAPHIGGCGEPAHPAFSAV
jgi:hypothetical protein